MAFEGLLYIIPAASNYIGGDIVSGLLKLDIHKQDETSLFFDIGTNGELVIGNKEWMMAGTGCSRPCIGRIHQLFWNAGRGGSYRFGQNSRGSAIITTIGK